MEPTRLASSSSKQQQQQQAAAASKQATSPAARLASPRATGVPRSKKMLPHYPGWCWDDKQSALGHGRPVSRPPKCSVRPSGRAQGGAPSGPEMAQNHQNLRWGPRKVLLSKLMDTINLGTVWGAFWLCLDLCGPETVSVGPKMGSFGPQMCPAG